jgi:hypothetical protein
MATCAQKLLQSEPLICIMYCRKGVREGAMSLNVRNRFYVLNGSKQDFAGH